MQNAKAIVVGGFFMVLRQRMAALLLGLAVVGPAAAGEESESHIHRPGLFFAWLSPDLGAVVVRADDAAHLRALARHCNADRPVFSLQAGEKYPCRIEVPPGPSGGEQWDEVRATVQDGPPRSDTQQYRLFSIAPPRTTRWTTRPIAAPEVQALEGVLRSDARLRAAVRSPLKLAAATVVHKPGGQDLAILVPGKLVQDRAGGYHARRHHVFTKDRKGYAYQGDVPAKVASFVDLDGAELPGLVVSEGCDGWCITLWSLAGGLRPVGRFGGH